MRLNTIKHIQVLSDRPLDSFSSRNNGIKYILTKPVIFSKNLASNLRFRWSRGVADLKQNPIQYLTIPLIAALVGYITNWLGVKMLFYPIEWRGIPIKRWPGQPLGFFGWQGVVPAKRIFMAEKMVDVTISRLLSISEAFSLLNPAILASELNKIVKSVVFNGAIPSPILNIFLRKTSKDFVNNIESIVDIKSLVVTGMTTDPKVFGNFFQLVGRKELSFLIESGTYFGFLLGLIQMLQWMLFPIQWTLPVGGAIVGYITNWIALKWIFEPLEPTKFGPLMLQGLFLTRQKEVSEEFCTYITDKVLNSREVWREILDKTNVFKLQDIISRNVPFLTTTHLNKITDKLRFDLVKLDPSFHPFHGYIDKTLNLKQTLITRMNLLTPREFEQVLHPIFQEDELTLILAGAFLGLLAGGLQWWFNVVWAKRTENKKQRLALANTGNSLLFKNYDIENTKLENGNSGITEKDDTQDDDDDEDGAEFYMKSNENNQKDEKGEEYLGSGYQGSNYQSGNESFDTGYQGDNYQYYSNNDNSDGSNTDNNDNDDGDDGGDDGSD